MIPKILVIGDSCEDVYIYGDCTCLCPDAPVPVFIPQRTVYNGGMARNVYENLCSLGADVEIYTNPEPITKTRYVDEKTNQMLVRVDSDGAPVARVSSLGSINYDLYDGIIVSDYCKGFLTEADISTICVAHPRVFLDSKKILGEYCHGCLFVKINELEHSMSLAAGVDLSAFRDSLIVTLGGVGCRHQEALYGVEEVDIKDMTGAGDSFLAAFTFKYLQNQDIPSCIKFANLCATEVVQTRGVTTIKTDNLL